MKTGRSRRPKLPAISEEMKAWCAALASEVSGWPQLATRTFFGFTALYRDETMFAILPRTRGMETANSLAFRLDAASPAMRARLGTDPRIGSAELQKARWFTLALSCDSDLHDALEWLGRAHEAADNKRKSR